MKKHILALLFLLCLGLSGCKQNPSEQALFAKLFTRFQDHGFECSLARLEDIDPEREVPIYHASVWYSLGLNGEEVLVYFDESNRADYLSAQIDEEDWGTVARFGLRFILVYGGDSPEILSVLQEMKEAPDRTSSDPELYRLVNGF